jgi:hypothetical protein
MFFTLVLAAVWFLFYWVIGGVFFACVALLRLIRIRKVRFSCLFSLSAAACAYAAARASVLWMERSALGCPEIEPRGAELFLKIFSCGFFQLALSALAGLLVLVTVGFLLLRLSSWKEKNWLTTFAERLELDNQDKDE